MHQRQFKNNAKDVPLNANLMFLKAIRLKSMRYGLEMILRTKNQGNDRPNENVISLPQLNSGVTHYWRVDAVNKNGI